MPYPAAIQPLTFARALNHPPAPATILQLAVDNFKRQFAHLEAGGRGQDRHLGQATSLPRERVRDFQSEAAKYMTRGAHHMSGVVGATAYASSAAPATTGGVYGQSAGRGMEAEDPSRAIEMLGSSVEKMLVMDAANGYGTSSGGYLYPQAQAPSAPVPGQPPPPTQDPGVAPAYAYASAPMPGQAPGVGGMHHRVASGQPLGAQLAQSAAGVPGRQGYAPPQQQQQQQQQYQQNLVRSNSSA